jgi:hypothetical protein
MPDAAKRAELIALVDRILRAEHPAVFDVADQWHGGGD